MSIETSSDPLRIDLVILGVSPKEADEDDAIAVVDPHHQPVLADNA
jgi:hypothetical protein